MSRPLNNISIIVSRSLIRGQTVLLALRNGQACWPDVTICTEMAIGQVTEYETQMCRLLLLFLWVIGALGMVEGIISAVWRSVWTIFYLSIDSDILILNCIVFLFNIPTLTTRIGHAHDVVIFNLVCTNSLCVVYLRVSVCLLDYPNK